MELTQLTQFKTIAECDTLTQAAQKLHISQPALSVMLKKLEGELGVSLFYRNKNRIELNSAGELVLIHAKAVLERAERMKEELALYAVRERSFSAVFCDPGPMWYAVPQFSIAYPQFEFKYRLFEENGDMAPLLLDRCHDVVVGANKITHPEVVSIPFLHDQLLLSVPEGCVLSGEPRISLKENRPDALRTIAQLYVGGYWYEKIQKPFWERLLPDVELVLYDDFFIFSQMAKVTGAFITTTRLVENYRDDGGGRIMIPLIDEELSITYYLSYLKRESGRLRPFLEWAELLSENSAVSGSY
ncbi:MAG: LysR family transcriptional regulator [Synergistaceae bacterium]|nr:LysR family transcriptional regulator [Synergistaceae bacterium]